jgi:hypothetical protein
MTTMRSLRLHPTNFTHTESVFDLHKTEINNIDNSVRLNIYALDKRGSRVLLGTHCKIMLQCTSTETCKKMQSLEPEDLRIRFTQGTRRINLKMERL